MSSVAFRPWPVDAPQSALEYDPDSRIEGCLAAALCLSGCRRLRCVAGLRGILFSDLKSAFEFRDTRVVVRA